MSTTQKQYAQFVWEDVEHNTVTRTYEIPNKASAIVFGVKNGAVYFTTYAADAPDDKLAGIGPRTYTTTMETELKTAAEIIHQLESYKEVPHLCKYMADILPRMFARVSRDSSLQDQFSAAAAKASNVEKFDALIGLLRQENPDQVFLTPSSAGFIKLESGDESYGADFKRRYPAPPR